MNGRSGPLSPASVEGSEWSGISRYQNAEQSSYSPSISTHHRANLITPPTSASSNSINGNLPTGMNRRPSDHPGNPSPPSSIARSSNGTSLSDSQTRKALIMEETLSHHYVVFKRYHAQTLRDDKGNARPNRARDKLLRLSPVQFQELSTDVYDELLRRQTATGQQTNGSGHVPTYLLPKDNFHPKRNQARQKLSTLPPQKFRELATDVFYELERRFPKFAGGDMERAGSPANSTRCPPSRQGTPNGIRPGSRGQGQSRPGPGPPPGHQPRNGSLGSQVFAGLGIPGVGGPDDAYGRPTAKTFQSSTIIPNKSRLVEDDDDQTGPEDNEDARSAIVIGGAESKRRMIAEFQGQVAELQERVNDMEMKVQDKNMEIERLQDAHRSKENAGGVERSEWAELRSDLQSKLTNALNLNSNLQTELEKVRTHHASTEREMRSQIDRAARQGGNDDEWKIRYEELEKDHQELQMEVREQEQITNEVKLEAAAFLSEMKALSDRSNQNWEREEKLSNQVHKLENELKEWKDRYTRTKTQLRTLRASSLGLSIQQPDTGFYINDGGCTQSDGLVKEVHVTKFQIAVDELLRSARSAEPNSVIDYVKSVVVAIRHITLDIGDTKPINDDLGEQRIKIKSRVSATANNLITASKNFASSNGLSPVSLLDAAASHLAVAVVELIRTVKIRPTPADELEDDYDDGSLLIDSPGPYGVQHARMSAYESIYSSLSSPEPHALPSVAQGKDLWGARKLWTSNGMPNGKEPGSTSRPDYSTRPQDSDIEELKIFLEDQTEALVHSIQSLVGSIRAEDNPAVIREQIGDIASIVGKVVAETQHASTETRNANLQHRAEPVISTLADCRTRLLDASVEGEGIRDAAAWKSFTNKLPPLAFEVARETKELVQRVDLVGEEGGGDVGDDF